mmetsp:Transcript_10831/g.34393  ORF Transcript_10831/g.34393 Transcript_10831/m.34393 type:complete len:256 (-) Transcript_10831:398-1165(-)
MEDEVDDRAEEGEVGRRALRGVDPAADTLGEYGVRRGEARPPAPPPSTILPSCSRVRAATVGGRGEASASRARGVNSDPGTTGAARSSGANTRGDAGNEPPESVGEVGRAACAPSCRAPRRIVSPLISVASRSCESGSAPLGFRTVPPAADASSTTDDRAPNTAARLSPRRRRASACRAARSSGPSGSATDGLAASSACRSSRRRCICSCARRIDPSRATTLAGGAMTGGATATRASPGSAAVGTAAIGLIVRRL